MTWVFSGKRKQQKDGKRKKRDEKPLERGQRYGMKEAAQEGQRNDGGLQEQTDQQGG